MELTAKERAQVKKVSRELLQTLKAEKLALDWRKRQQARAQVRVAIETLLDQGLPEACSTRAMGPSPSPSTTMPGSSRGPWPSATWMGSTDPTSPWRTRAAPKSQCC